MRTSTNSNHRRAMRRPDVRKRIAAAVAKSWITRREQAARGRAALAQVERTGVAIAPLEKGGQRQAASWMARGLTRPELVFPSNARTPHDHSKVRKIVMAILKKADLRHRSLHAMRHTFISLLLQQGESPAYVQKQAGHRSMDLTINVYGHFLPGGNRDAVNRLDDVSPRRQDAVA